MCDVMMSVCSVEVIDPKQLGSRSALFTGSPLSQIHSKSLSRPPPVPLGSNHCPSAVRALSMWQHYIPHCPSWLSDWLRL